MHLSLRNQKKQNKKKKKKKKMPRVKSRTMAKENP